jgi:hypothetical protein
VSDVVIGVIGGGVVTDPEPQPASTSKVALIAIHAGERDGPTIRPLAARRASTPINSIPAMIAKAKNIFLSFFSLFVVSYRLFHIPTIIIRKLSHQHIYQLSTQAS